MQPQSREGVTVPLLISLSVEEQSYDEELALLKGSLFGGVGVVREGLSVQNLRDIASRIDGGALVSVRHQAAQVHDILMLWRQLYLPPV